MYHWERIRERAGLPELRVHDLRHSFASYPVNKGYSLYIVQQLLGHRRPKTTQRYAHLAPKKLLEAADCVADLVKTRPLREADNQGDKCTDGEQPEAAEDSKATLEDV